MSETLEHIKEIPSLNPEATKVLGSLGLKDELVMQGDRQLPGEPNRGFKIIQVEHEQSPIRPEVALPLSYDEAMKKGYEEMAAGIVKGIYPLDITDDIRSSVLTLNYPITESAYAKAVAEGVVAPSLFEAGAISALQPGAQALERLVPTDQKTHLIEAELERANASNLMVNELDGAYEFSDKELEQLTEAYDFTDGGDNSIRLLNLTPTKMSDEQIRQVANVIRSFSDKSGGLLFKRLRTILILPEDMISEQVTDANGDTFDLPYAGAARDGFIRITERSIQPMDAREPWTDQVKEHWANRYKAQLLPGEPEQGPGSPINNASREGFEPVIEKLLAHEMEHLALPPSEDKENAVKIKGPGPTLYSRFSHREKEAELAALDYAGWQEVVDGLDDLPEDERRFKLELWDQQRADKQEMWRRQRGSGDGGRTYKTPLGPRFVTCRELDLTKGPLPLRKKYPNKKISAVVTYHLVPDAYDNQDEAKETQASTK